MTDDIDRANDHVEALTEHSIRANARDLPPGEPGICSECGEHSERLVRGACAPCREEFGDD